MISRLEIEQKVLGSLLSLQPQELTLYLSLLNENYFSVEKHKQIFKAIKELQESTGLDSVYVYLKNHNVDISASELAELTDNAVRLRGEIEFFISELINIHIREMFKTRARKIVRKDAISLIDELQNFIIEAVAELNHSYGKILSAKEIAEQYESIFRAYKDNQRVNISTGFFELDRYIGGLVPGTLIVLAGRPGMGKTTFALDLLLNLAKNNTPTMFISLEMTIETLLEKIVGKHLVLSINAIRAGRFDPDKLGDVLLSFAQLPLHITDSISALPNMLTYMKLATLKGIKVFIIDYLQQIYIAERRNESLAYQIGYVCQQLKNFAVQNNSIVILLSQLSRKVEYREDKRPLLSDLRDSGRIEEHADIVLMLYRPAYYEENPPENIRHQAFIDIKKNRYGPTAEIELHFDPITGFKNKESEVINGGKEEKEDELPF